MTVNEILQYLNTIAPFSFAAADDNIGLLVGNGRTEVSGICCALDITNEVIAEAVKNGANLIISHHPVIFDPLKTVPAGSPVFNLIRAGISAICIHTNFDVSEGGVNDALLEMLEFKKKEVLEVTKPNGIGFGAVVDLPFEFTPVSLAEHCKTCLGIENIKYTRLDVEIKRVAVSCGSGLNDTTMKLARAKRCGAIITGDIKYHYWIEALNTGMILIDAGHYGTEQCAPHRIAALVTRFHNAVPVFVADSNVEPFFYV